MNTASAPNTRQCRARRSPAARGKGGPLRGGPHAPCRGDSGHARLHQAIRRDGLHACTEAVEGANLRLLRAHAFRSAPSACWRVCMRLTCA